jgi:hypothetical protein
MVLRCRVWVLSEEMDGVKDEKRKGRKKGGD